MKQVFSQSRGKKTEHARKLTEVKQVAYKIEELAKRRPGFEIMQVVYIEWIAATPVRVLLEKPPILLPPSVLQSAFSSSKNED